MTSAIISAAAGLLGVLIGAGSSWVLARRQHRLATTLEMHREFNTGEMAMSRHLAEKLALDNRAKTYMELYQELPFEQMKCFWEVVSFYQRLWLLIRHRHIRKDYAAELFADEFYAWLALSLESQLLPLEVQIARDISALRDWMDRHTTAEDRRRAREEAVTWEQPRLDPPSADKAQTTYKPSASANTTNAQNDPN
jgi:hypothetical protein